MSSTALDPQASRRHDYRKTADAAENVFLRCLDVVGSMKFTIVLLLLAMVIVFVGSLAQARRDVWLVVQEYFRTYLAHIQIKDLFPPAMFPGLVDFNWGRLGIFQSIPFPGGWTIGWLMLINLLTAHILRLRVRVRGGRLLGGVAVIVTGALLTAVVVTTGNQQTGVEAARTVLTPMQIWYLMLAVLGISAVVPIAIGILRQKQTTAERRILLAVGGTLAAMLLYFLIGGESARLNLSSMRILWQLLKGAACSMVLLLGCNLLFEKRGGIVLLHTGVALLMLSELMVGLYAKENLLAISEGQTSEFMRDVRSRELAIVLRQDNGKDQVVAIPDALLVDAAPESEDQKGEVIPLESLPFDIRVNSFLRNTRLRSALPGDDKLATTGLGTFAMPVEIDPVTGMDDSHDMSTVAIDVLRKGSDELLASVLVAQDISETRTVPIAEQISVDGTDFQFYLRFHRNYKDYDVTLLDVSRKNYVGSATPRDYRSKISIRDRETSAVEEFTVWMNNPLRYKGETFYQSGYNKLPNGTEMTTLSVVRNTGWMLPYIACMIVSFGMFAQFWQTLSRHLGRVSRKKPVAAEAETSADQDSPFPPTYVESPGPADSTDTTTPLLVSKNGTWSTGSMIVCGLIVVSGICLLYPNARAPKTDPDAMNLFEFAQLPVAWKGRAQPIDSFARTELLMASHKSTFKGELDLAELDANRKEILEGLAKYWPDVDTLSMAEFQGQYSDWINRICELTASGEDAVEERIRSRMVRRMPAVRWFLDAVARKELADRHRVIKIDNDQVLSLLSLEKRPGLAYSLVEVRRNIDSLESMHREGLKLTMAEQEHRMTSEQRAIVKLFQTVERIESLPNFFLTGETTGALDALARSWFVLEQLGERPAIMVVPTNAEDDQRSWETLLAAGALQSLRTELKERGIATRDELNDYLRIGLAREMVGESVPRSYEVIQGIAQSESPDQEVDGAAVRKAAAERIAGLNSEPYLQEILRIIAESDPDVAREEIVAGLSEEQIQNLAAERISSQVYQIFQVLNQDGERRDPRIDELRGRLRTLQAQDEMDEGALMQAMNWELISIALHDIDQRAGHLLFNEDGALAEDNEAFETSTASMITMLNAWGQGDVETFNSTVSEYSAFLASGELSHLDADKVTAEAWFNHYDPFFKSIYLYLMLVLIPSFCSWLIWPKALRRTAFWMMMLAFVVHTAALGVRMWISGRPPVTNLYSSAIFIGWAMVLAAFFVERIVGYGIGNILGASVGSGTLVIAHFLSVGDGDTLGVMQAVLDTTFWLATHVVCITLGYAATFLAGVLGFAYVVVCFTQKTVKEDVSDIKAVLGKLVYGVLCFAVFFSLVGTVLGGLWADDSWGRFWGWDPKENGAMMIVLWNALILHARWDKMVKDYGTAVLAMTGNIVTAWSWFGVNELRAGLHSYGFTDGRLLALVVFIGLQSAIILAATIPAIGRSANRKIEPAA